MFQLGHLLVTHSTVSDIQGFLACSRLVRNELPGHGIALKAAVLDPPCDCACPPRPGARCSLCS